MLLPRRLLSIASAVAMLIASTSAASPSLDGWFDCSAVTFAESVPETEAPSGSSAGSAEANLMNGYPIAECATFKAPLCYDGVCKDASGTEIDVFVKRIQAVADGKPNIFFMQGGPGAASPAMESAMTGIYAILKGNVNVYTMDHRGTGRSTKLDCVAAQAMTSASPGGASIDASEVANCAADIENKYGSDRSSFSVTSAASDLKYFITNFLKDETTFVYGVSYGTSLVERLIHLNTTGIAGYVLDGISTSSGSDKKNFEYFSTWDPDYDEVAQYFLSYCAKNNDECGKYFKDTTLAATLKTLLANVDDVKSTYKCYKPLDAMLSSLYKYEEGQYTVGSSLRSFFGSLFADATLRTFIPVIAYRATRCNSDDVNVMTHLFNKYAAYSDYKSEDDTYSSDLLYQMIVYSEFWEEPTPTTDEMYARFLNTSISSGSYGAVQTYCLFSKENSKACAEYAEDQKYNASALVYKRDKYWNVAAKPSKDVSVMLMSSKMDPQTPHKYAEFLYKALDTDNKELIVFDQATHGTLWSTPLSNEDPDAKICGMELVASYVANLGDLKKMDKSCVAQMPAVNMSVPDRLVRTWLNASSPIDGKFTGVSTQASGDSGSSDSSSKSYKTVFIVFLVLFVLATFSTAVFLFKWRRAAKASSTTDAGVYEESKA